jgi:hypothetical protein
MPELKVFVPCEKVIIGEHDNNPTLVSFIATISGRYELQPGETADENARAPMPWEVFSLWYRPEEEEPTDCEQRIVLKDPNGSVRIEHSHPFNMAEKRWQRVIHRVPGFPLTPSGIWRLELYSRKKGENGEWPDWTDKPLAEYPITLQIEIVEAVGATPGLSTHAAERADA